MAVKLLKSTADNVAAISEHQQIAESVELVTKNIREYNKESDLAVLEDIKNTCIKKNMTEEMAKMYRNVGMHHFFRNNFGDAIISMELAIDILKREKLINSLAEYYSELGLIYFYNREYLYSKRCCEETEELLYQVTDISDQILFNHYCRYGVLLSNMQEYASSKRILEKAILYADDDKDTGLIVMNIGLLYKKQKDLKAALRYYSKALCLFEVSDTKAKGVVYNNIAEVYKILGQYEKALSYIEKAFKCIEDNDLSRMFVYFNTFTEIKILMGERESVLDEFIELLDRVRDFHLYKGLIIEGINNMIMIGSEDKGMLKRLEAAIESLIKDNPYGNEEYLKELKSCLSNIRLCLKEI